MSMSPIISSGNQVSDQGIPPATLSRLDLSQEVRIGLLESIREVALRLHPTVTNCEISVSQEDDKASLTLSGEDLTEHRARRFAQFIALASQHELTVNASPYCFISTVPNITIEAAGIPTSPYARPETQTAIEVLLRHLRSPEESSKPVIQGQHPAQELILSILDDTPSTRSEVLRSPEGVTIAKIATGYESLGKPWLHGLLSALSEIEIQHPDYPIKLVLEPELFLICSEELRTSEPWQFQSVDEEALTATIEVASLENLINEGETARSLDQLTTRIRDRSGYTVTFAEEPGLAKELEGSFVLKQPSLLPRTGNEISALCEQLEAELPPALGKCSVRAGIGNFLIVQYETHAVPESYLEIVRKQLQRYRIPLSFRNEGGPASDLSEEMIRDVIERTSPVGLHKVSISPTEVSVTAYVSDGDSQNLDSWADDLTRYLSTNTTDEPRSLHVSSEQIPDEIARELARLAPWERQFLERAIDPEGKIEGLGAEVDTLWLESVVKPNQVHIQLNNRQLDARQVRRVSLEDITIYPTNGKNRLSESGISITPMDNEGIRIGFHVIDAIALRSWNSNADLQFLRLQGWNTPESPSLPEFPQSIDLSTQEQLPLLSGFFDFSSDGELANSCFLRTLGTFSSLNSSTLFASRDPAHQSATDQFEMAGMLLEDLPHIKRLPDEKPSSLKAVEYSRQLFQRRILEELSRDEVSWIERHPDGSYQMVHNSPTAANGGFVSSPLSRRDGFLTLSQFMKVRFGGYSFEDIDLIGEIDRLNRLQIARSTAGFDLTQNIMSLSALVREHGVVHEALVNDLTISGSHPFASTTLQGLNKEVSARLRLGQSGEDKLSLKGPSGQEWIEARKSSKKISIKPGRTVPIRIARARLVGQEAKLVVVLEF